MSGRAIFTLDLERCTGCSACVVACRNHNRTEAGLNWRTVTSFNARRDPRIAVVHYALSCNHCAAPPCLAGCPAVAYEIGQDGVVTLHPDRCMGCRYCSWVCPYDAPKFNPDLGTMAKCTLCPELRDQNRSPACVAACPVEALGFDPMGEVNDQSCPGFPETGTRPGVQIIRQSGHWSAPQSTIEQAVQDTTEESWTPSLRSAMRAEWPLWLFTSAVMWMVVWMALAVVNEMRIMALPFAAVGLTAMAVSAAHLGQVRRAWRAPLNFASSWVSREIVFFGLFMMIGLASGFVRWPIVDDIALAFGVLTLLSIDMVYCVRGQEVPMFGHSAMTLLAAPFLVFLIQGWALPLVVIAVFRLVLYVERQQRMRWFIFRVSGLVLLPVLMWVVDSPLGALAVVILIAIAELIDRAELYAGLRFLTPELQARRDFRSLPSR